MGGFGSTRWAWTSTKDTVESNCSLDINRLNRTGCLRSGYRGSLEWKQDGERIASIRFRRDGDVLVLSYRVRRPGEEWRDVEQPTRIVWTPCRFGATRPYFVCPGVVKGIACGCRAAKLYGAGTYFLCRHCYRLAYVSQREDRYDRALRRANNIRMRLGGEPGTASAFPARPKGMHAQTYERLRSAVLSAEMLAEERLAILLGRLQRSDRRTERRSAGSAKEGFLDMSLADNVAPLPQLRGGKYEFARFNALRHGVLSRHTVLPWEAGDEYRALVEALVAEHKPEGPTEEHLVEELGGVIWRKRRLRLGEAAAHHRALKRSTDPFGETAKAALVHVPGDMDNHSVTDAITATEEQTAEEQRHLEDDKAMTEEALRILARSSPSAYSRALAALHDDTQAWWQEQLSWGPDDYDEDQTPYSADAEGLKRFLEDEVLPWYEKRRRELGYLPLIREQAFGEAVDPDRLERLARYEVHLDRKLERMLVMLFKLQELRRAANPT